MIRTSSFSEDFTTRSSYPRVATDFESKSYHEMESYNHYAYGHDTDMSFCDPSFTPSISSANAVAFPSNVEHNSQMSPPLTPRTSHEVLSPTLSHPETTFHHYLRAFYHFHPESTVSSTGDESSITVPINQGDVILVHSIHPNGWADGSLLTSGARGWLPTNYCEPYEPPEVRSLLNSLTNLWDLVRSPEHESLLVFSRQDYVKGMIAGVRLFLVSFSINYHRLIRFRRPCCATTK